MEYFCRRDDNLNKLQMYACHKISVLCGLAEFIKASNAKQMTWLWVFLTKYVKIKQRNFSKFDYISLFVTRMQIITIHLYVLGWTHLQNVQQVIRT